MKWSALILALLMLTTTIPCSGEQQPWDVREQDTIIVGAIEVGEFPWPDSIGIPIYIWADDTLGGFSLAFHPSDSRLRVSSFDHTASVISSMGGNWLLPPVDSVANTIGIGYFDAMAAWIENPQGLIGTLYLKVDPAIPGESEFLIDSASIGPALYFELTTVVNTYPHSVRPAPFSNRGGANIVFPELPYLCGDADGDGIANITDAVFLITYIFSEGPPPEPLAAGDANCDGIPNITDAVYLITYIFGGGPAPCADCP
ncbi:MAG: dockerin type I repeat-containing protein [bacterium]